MKSTIWYYLRSVFLGALLPLSLLGLWHLVWMRGESGGVVPAIRDVVAIVVTPWVEPESIDAPSLWFSYQTSILRVLIGFLLATITAIPLGLLMGRNNTVQSILGPFATMMRVVCPIAWIPVAIVIMGIVPLSNTLYGEVNGWRHEILYEIQPAMILIVASGAFFPILLASASGARSIRKSLQETVVLMGATRGQRFRHVIVPHALPQILSGMRIGLGLAWMVIIAAELYPGTRSGLGYTIEVSQTDNMQYEYAFAAIFYIMATGLLINGFLWMVEHRVGHWQAEQR